jgi:hypothetical protein
MGRPNTFEALGPRFGDLVALRVFKSWGWSMRDGMAPGDEPINAKLSGVVKPPGVEKFCKVTKGTDVPSVHCYSLGNLPADDTCRKTIHQRLVPTEPTGNVYYRISIDHP